MAFKKSPGQTKTCLVRLDQNTAEVRDALLYDFDIDDDGLNEAHKQHLAQAMQWMGPRREPAHAEQRPVIPVVCQKLRVLERVGM
jgi:hypothetical protein